MGNYITRVRVTKPQPRRYAPTTHDLSFAGQRIGFVVAHGSIRLHRELDAQRAQELVEVDTPISILLGIRTATTGLGFNLLQRPPWRSVIVKDHVLRSSTPMRPSPR